MLQRWVAWLVAQGRRILERLFEMQFIDRGLALGAQAFGALIPLLIVLDYLAPHNKRSFAESVIHRFGISGPGASAVRTAFNGTASGGTLTVIGVTIVLFSALSFTRRLQRTLELSWDLPSAGLRGTAAGLRWLVLLSIYVALKPLLGGAVHGTVALVVGVAEAFVVWLVTPWVLLSGRVAWRTLMPQAGLCAIGMSLFGLFAAIYVPHQISRSATEYGAIGVAFTFLTLLWTAGFIVVAATAIGSMRHAEAHKAAQASAPNA